MKEKLLFTILLSAVLLLASSPTIAQTEKAEAAIQQLMQTTPVVGLSVAVVKDNKIIYNQSFGFKDVEKEEGRLAFFFSILKQDEVKIGWR